MKRIGFSIILIMILKVIKTKAFSLILKKQQHYIGISNKVDQNENFENMTTEARRS